MRPVVRGGRPRDDDGNEIQYNNYTNARGELIKRLGEYCSYCEMQLDSSLHLEHVQPKKPLGADEVDRDRELDWNNFLLSCTNCNSTKRTKNVELNDYLWPDCDNTFMALQYSEGGLVSPSEEITGDLKRKVEETIKLTGLDKHPLNNPKASDRRWQNRREAWDEAQRSMTRLRSCDTPEMREEIAEHAAAKGYWSIWMTVFKDDTDLLCRFIQGFPGTCNDCFDPRAGYAPVTRAGGQC